MTPQRWRVVAVAAIVAVLAGSLAPGSTAGGLPAGADKLLHAAGYATIAFAVAAARRARALRALAAVVLAVALFGAAVELVQPTVGRTASLLDALANLLGATAGAAVRWRTAS
ncbi:VanZ family protein [Halobacterium sp. R2-5]|uniref:VanZ family protein n=1 Tax=Halobacterium sp. R2-5 TaxID=2715751 RepID=UPI001AAF1212|nr:VanZ family protein [Halobacterium sp. R2-5]